MMLTAAIVRALRGAPITVLMLMMIERQPLTLGYIRRHTGYTDKVIHDAVMLLQDYGMAVQTGRYTWQIAAGVQQLPLGEALPAPEEIETPSQIDEPAADQDVIETAANDLTILGRNNSDLNPLASSGFNQILESGNLLLPDSRAASSEFFRANLRALDEHNIREPARSRLARLAHVTPGTVRYHCGTAKNSGQAIYRIEHNWPAPADWVFEQRDEIDPTPDEPVPELSPVSAETQTAWGFALGQLAGELSRADNETWARSAWPAGMDGGTLVVGANNPIHVAWLEQHVRRRLEELIGCPVRCEVRYDPG